MIGEGAQVRIDLSDEKAARSLANFVALYNRSTEEAKKSTDNWKQSVIALNQGIELATKTINAFYGAVKTGVGVLSDVVKGTVGYHTSISALAQQAGATTTSIQGMTLAAQKFGVEGQDIQQSLKGITNKMQEAVSGGTATAQMFQSLGIRIQNFDGSLRNSIDVMRDLSDRFKAMPDGANKTAIALRLMEESGLKMVGFLSQGSKALDETAAKMKQLGLVADETAIKAGVDLGKALNWSGTMIEGVYRKLGDMLIPGVLEATRAFNSFVENALQKADWTAVRGGIADVVAALREIVPVVTAASQAVLVLLDKLQRIKSYAVVGAATVSNNTQNFREWVFGKIIGSGVLGGTEKQRANALATIESRKAERNAGLNEFAAGEFSSMDTVSKGYGAAESAIGSMGQGIYSLGGAAERGIRNGAAGGGSGAGGGGGGSSGVEVLYGGGGGGGLYSPGAGGMLAMREAPKMVEAAGAVGTLTNAVAGLGVAAASATPNVMRGAGAMRANFDGLMYHASGEAPRLPSVNGFQGLGGITNHDGGMARSLYAFGSGGGGGSFDYNTASAASRKSAWDAMQSQFAGFGGVRQGGTIGPLERSFEQVGGGTPGSGGAPGSIGRMMWGMGSVFEGQRFNDWASGGYDQYQANQARGAQMRGAWNAQMAGNTANARQQQAEMFERAEVARQATIQANAAFGQQRDDIYRAAEVRRQYGDKVPGDVMNRLPEGVKSVLTGASKIGDTFGLVAKAAQQLATTLAAIRTQLAASSTSFRATRNFQDSHARLINDGVIA